MALPFTHADTYQLSRQVGGSVNRAGVTTLLTNATVIAADTVAGLGIAINSAVVHADQQNFKTRIVAALGKDGGITNASVLNLTTVAGLTALTDMGSSTQVMLLD